MWWMDRRSHAKGQHYYIELCLIQGEPVIVICAVLQAKDKNNLQKIQLWKLSWILSLVKQ